LVNYTNGGERLCKSFEGHSAYSEACDFYERARAEPTISSLDLCRLDGASWKWVRKPQSRDDAGSGSLIPATDALALAKGRRTINACLVTAADKRHTTRAKQRPITTHQMRRH
jgi:hypothetical protein